MPPASNVRSARDTTVGFPSDSWLSFALIALSLRVSDAPTPVIAIAR
jgi:hypothetical protein